MSLTTWLLWSTHLIGSDSILARSSTSTPPKNSNADTMSKGRPQLVGSEPSLTTIFSTKLSGRTSVRFLYSRIPSADAGTTMPTITSTTMPIASRTPKSRIMGTLEMRSAAKATTAVNGGSEQRWCKVRHRLGDGVRLLVEHHLLLDTVVDLDREVDAHPDEDRQTRDRHERQADADHPEDRERPEHTDDHGEQGKQPPPNPEHDEQDDRHQHQRCGTKAEHAALEIVVEIGEVHRRAGHREIESLELGVLQDVDDLLGPRRLRVEIGVAFEHDTTDGGAVDDAPFDVRERRIERQADPALVVGRWDDGAVFGNGEPAVVVDQQLVVGRIPDDPLLLGDLTEPGERGGDVGLTCFGTRFVTSGGRQQRRRADGA